MQNVRLESGKVFNGIVKKDFLNLKDCEYLIKSAVESNLWENGGSGFWENRVINYHTILKYDKKAGEIMLDASSRCGNIIKNNYSIPEIYFDTLQLIRWFPGMEQPPHADDMTNTDIAGFVHREYGSIIYLNDNYRGGQTYYPNFDIKITPISGTLAIHPGDPKHLHGVTKVEEQTRYTIAAFWTQKKERQYDWSIY